MKKKDGRKGLAGVMHGDLWGLRAAKYDALEATSLTAPVFERLESPAPQYPFVRRDYAVLEKYEKGFQLSQFLPINCVGFQTHRDEFAVDFSKNVLNDRTAALIDLEQPTDELYRRFRTKDNRDWQLDAVRRKLSNKTDPFAAISHFAYRPFDNRWCHFSYEFMDFPRRQLLAHVFNRENLVLLSSRQQGRLGYFHSFIANLVPNDCVVSNRSREANQCFPLYLYPDEQDLDQTRRINFDPKLYAKLQKLAKHPERGTPDEVQVFDCIYGVLHCPAYRDTYAEFLKIDFPRIPWPTTPDEFWDVSAKGTELRKLHLMEPAAIGQTPYPFTGDGDNVVGKPRFEDSRIWINDSQYFADAPPVSWDFYIGGYQPAQKWLKDRKGRDLSFEDVKHYQRILKILSETNRIMRTIEMSLE